MTKNSRKKPKRRGKRYDSKFPSENVNGTFKAHFSNTFLFTCYIIYLCFCSSLLHTQDGDGTKQKRSKRASKDLSAAQLAVNEQMRRALEDDAYSALGSIVDTDTDDDDFDHRMLKGNVVRLDRSTILAAMRKRLWVERMSSASSGDNNTSRAVVSTAASADGIVGGVATCTEANPKKRKKVTVVPSRKEEPTVVAEDADDVMERDEGSIFGQTTGASNATWVECDKCKKVRWHGCSIAFDEALFV